MHASWTVWLGVVNCYACVRGSFFVNVVNPVNPPKSQRFVLLIRPQWYVVNPVNPFFRQRLILLIRSNIYVNPVNPQLVRG